MYSIGQLAKTADITVRTLRYYDQIGLLPPNSVDRAGKRYYNSEAAAKLQIIVMLKELGFSLETIHEMMEKQVQSPKDLLSMRLHIIELEQQRLDKAKERIHFLIQMMELEGTEDWEYFVDYVSSNQVSAQEMAEKWDRHFTKGELDKIARLPEVGQDIEQINKWIHIVKDIRNILGTDPASPKAQELAKRWLDLAYEMFDDDRELAHKVWQVNDEENLGFYHFDEEVVAFINKACEHLFQEQNGGGNL
ncbi:MerR family transcriptional regulator [Lentibacillus sp. L22]|uniref:MerR family transcriptional regulator n=1 Tax=Lentibacillus TaxID=175304 RepID=UPI0022B182B0|nr:MerR family transcriptional regulator [Lentibacillus daqui]